MAGRKMVPTPKPADDIKRYMPGYNTGIAGGKNIPNSTVKPPRAKAAPAKGAMPVSMGRGYNGGIAAGKGFPNATVKPSQKGTSGKTGAMRVTRKSK